TTLLPNSETFIFKQALALRGYSPLFLSNNVEPRGALDADLLLNYSNHLVAKLENDALRLRLPTPFLDRVIRRLKPALIHAHFGPEGLRASWLASRLGLPLIVTIHGSDVTVSPEWATKHGQRAYFAHLPRLFDQADRFVAVSHFIRERMLTLGFPEKKITTHYIGAHIDPMEEVDFLRPDPIALFVGRFVEVKNPLGAIRAVSEAVTRMGHGRLVMVGDGEQLAEARALAEKLLPGTKFLGRVDPRTVRNYMAKARLLVLPSVVHHSGAEEGLPTVCTEAMAAGLPIIAYDTGGVSEAVTDAAGSLLKVGDEAALASEIANYFGDARASARRGRAARTRATELFNLEIQTSRLEDIYSSVIRQS
ncbi:MAG: glycosyltransferase, partial [Actinobacteria bacterium]|nr:glycosyltransferase [Actinomycetota bacterium]